MPGSLLPPAIQAGLVVENSFFLEAREMKRVRNASIQLADSRSALGRKQCFSFSAA
jgi:hypothetical protein